MGSGSGLGVLLNDCDCGWLLSLGGVLLESLLEPVLSLEGVLVVSLSVLEVSGAVLLEVLALVTG